MNRNSGKACAGQLMRSLPTPCRSASTDRADRIRMEQRAAPQCSHPVFRGNGSGCQLTAADLQSLSTAREVPRSDSVCGTPRSMAGSAPASPFVRSPPGSTFAGGLLGPDWASPDPASASPQVYVGSSRGGSPSTVPQVLSEASTSPPELPGCEAGILVDSRPRESEELHVDAANGCSGAPCASGPPAPWSWGARTDLAERDLNIMNPGFLQPSSGEKGKPKAPAPGSENTFVAQPDPGGNTTASQCGADNLAVPTLGQTDENTPPSETSFGTSISFNMSPMTVASAVPFIGKSEPNGETRRRSLSLTSRSSRTSLAPSRIAADSPVPLPDSPTHEAQPLADTPASEGTGMITPVAGGAHDGQTPSLQGGGCGSSSSSAPASTSKVAQMRSLWERRFSAAAEAGGSSASTNSSKVYGRGRALGDDRRSSAWFRCASQMVRRLQHQEDRTNRKVNHLMERLREVTGASDAGSPLSSVPSEPESPFDKEPCDSPTSQLHQQMVRNIESQHRSQQRLSKALLRIVSLDTVFRQAEEGQRRAVVDAVAGPKAGHLSGDVESDDFRSTKELWQGADLAVADRMALKADSSHSSRRTSAQQPEEEAEAPSLPDATAATRPAGKVAPDESHDRGEVDISRQSQSTCLTDEPAREPQPKESPRDEEESACLPSVFQELLSLDPDDELTGVAAEGSDGPGTPPQNGDSGLPLGDAAEEAEASAIDSSSETDNGGTEVAEPDDSFEATNRPRAGEEGMPRAETYLYQSEQSEMHKQVLVIVPEGMGENRLVSFVYENKKHDVKIPEGYSVGQEVAIFVPKRPPLERNAAQAMCRGHAGFPDRLNVTEPLKHSSRARPPCSLEDPEFRHRHQLYTLLRGAMMSPLLPFTPEEPEYEEESDGDQPAGVI